MNMPEKKSDDFNRFNNICENISTIAHVAIVGYIVYIIILCSKDTPDLGTWHVTLYAVGWLLLMGEAILSITKNNVFTNRMIPATRVRIHWVMQTASAVCVLGGFAVMYQAKENYKNKHFKSWHGLLGFIAFICCFPTYLNGIAALFNVDLRKIIKPAVNKLIHAICGILTFLIGGVAMVLSVETGWFKRRTSKEIQDFWFWLLLFSIVWTVIQPLLTAFNRIKAFFT